ncbi:UDP-N-acetylglucosamine 1-carboxyvinyltransferase [Actinocorallia sp. A-T 12471]|uniref:UDP-N-acetylglucosamine 1-carboxyvinyltransferase n=1 Tax=Actinocorallia sp. A-T 12471 TaxID=3089813 RepID=UPI0029CD0000|nr:UDP-N-acetylglucosamine 1-carboxyvinyltransferase [Actinocorallia sp. A-T 12471]MDX6740189.1 UDP-N-acetylglucosamine 1-carboxyvinyltransferase [Actinocorallia sp. A-T 12471]
MTGTDAMTTDRHLYRITGGAPLKGEVPVSGAKNAVTKQMVAALLTEEPVTIANVPRIVEVDLVVGMLRQLGVDVDWTGDHEIRVEAGAIADSGLAERYTGANRIPILMMGPLLHRVREAVIPLPGGCQIGKRPIDYHLDALRQMGAEVTEQPTAVHVKTTGLVGAHITLAFPSVGATENIVLAAVLARGTTVIHNAAVEPEIIDTILMLQKMGALIEVQTDRRIVIEGVRRLTGTTHSAITDRVEAASFAAAAVATGGSLEVIGARQADLTGLINTLHRIGGGFAETSRGLTFYRARDLTATSFRTDVHPGLLTDWQQPLVLLLTQAAGTSVVHETIYEDRFGYTLQLREMGARIELSTACLGGDACRFANRDHAHSAVISGPTPLSGRELEIPDLRAGFAFVLAALVADGTSTISGTRYLERGYEDPVSRLTAMGGQVDTVPVG